MIEMSMCNDLNVTAKIDVHECDYDCRFTHEYSCLFALEYSCLFTHEYACLFTHHTLQHRHMKRPGSHLEGNARATCRQRNSADLQ